MIQEFKDEVLDTNLQPDVEPRYTIRNNAGNVLNDNVKIELKTPVIENGTPLNKATMGNIQGDLYTQDRYNKPAIVNGVLTLDLPLTSYEADKVVKIQCSQTLTNPKININQLGDKLINGTIVANEKISLIYNGESFDIIENYPKASTVQAQGGDSDATFMTPLKVKQAMQYYNKPSNNLSIKTGTISNGSTIPKTAGYTNYIYFVSVNKASSYDGESSASQSVYPDTYIDCSVNQSTRVVSCHAGHRSKTYSSSTWTLTEGTANYIEFAWN